MSQPTRRTILKSAAVALTASTAVYAQVESLGKEFVDAPTTQAVGRTLRVRMQEADGSPLEAERAKTITVRDMRGDPIPVGIGMSPGVAAIMLPGEPVQITLRLKMPGFGEVYCYADNGGFGYAVPGEIEFVAEAARTRHLRVRRALANALDDGTPLPDAFFRQLEDARTLAGYESLAEGMRAGETLATERARHRIAK